MEPVSCGWTVVRRVRCRALSSSVGFLSRNASRCGFQRTVAVRVGLRLLDRCSRVARGAFYPLCRGVSDACFRNVHSVRKNIGGRRFLLVPMLCAQLHAFARERWGQGSIRPVLKH